MQSINTAKKGVVFATGLLTACIMFGQTGSALARGARPATDSGPDPAPQAAPADPTSPPDPVRDCLVARVNELRAGQGASPVAEHPSLVRVAQVHSQEMAAAQSMYHTGSEVFAQLPLGWSGYGEDVVYGHDCDQMWDAFMNSEPHREIILRPDFNYLGIATAASGDGWIYATVAFLKHAPPVALKPRAVAPPAPNGPKGSAAPVAPPPGAVAPATGAVTLLPAPVNGLTVPESVVGGQGGPPQEIVLGVAAPPPAEAQEILLGPAPLAATPEQTLAKGDELKAEPGLDMPPGQGESAVVTFDLTRSI